FETAGIARRFCVATAARSAKACLGPRRLALLRRGCRHRRRSIATRATDGALKNRMDQARRVRRTVWDDERGGDIADRYHGQSRRRRLGPMQGGTVRRVARACRGRKAVGEDALRRIGRDRRWEEGGPRWQRRNNSLLASRTVVV